MNEALLPFSVGPVIDPTTRVARQPLGIRLQNLISSINHRFDHVNIPRILLPPLYLLQNWTLLSQRIVTRKITHLASEQRRRCGNDELHKPYLQQETTLKNITKATCDVDSLFT